jgi:gentisate 1,2-dioxygenase
MPTKTQTTTTHYHIQKKRRKEFIEEWRNYRQSVIRKEDVKLEKTARGLRTGVYMATAPPDAWMPSCTRSIPA